MQGILLLVCMGLLLPAQGGETLPTRSVWHALTSAYIQDIYHNWDGNADGTSDYKASFWLRLKAKRVDGPIIAYAYQNWTSEGKIVFVARGKYNRTTPAIIDIAIEKRPDKKVWATWRAWKDMQPTSPNLVRGTTDLLWGTQTPVPILQESWRVE